jgi:flavin reductase (DIM6/NTAB) family NADH-FMN oxidoreductase RutF
VSCEEKQGSMEGTIIKPEDFRAAMSSFAAGVTVITTLDANGAPQAVTATAFSSVSMTPPLCLVCINKRTRTHQPLLLTRHFAVNILGADQQWVSARFASSAGDRFASVEWSAGDTTGCPIIEGALAWMECRIVEVHSGGDHDIFLGSPISVRVHEGAPLVYWRGNYSSLPPPPNDEQESNAPPHTSH